MPQNTPSAEVSISHDLVHTLLQEFVPALANEPLELVGSGWDNEIHRIGPDHAVRLPRREAASRLVENEQRWLPELEKRLPVPIPTPTFNGGPAFGYLWHWSVVPWLPGVPLAHAPMLTPGKIIGDLAEFLNALHTPAPSDAPHNPYRSVPLSARTEALHEAAEQLESELQTQVVDLWDEIVDTPQWSGPPTWIHGDLHPLNALVRAGRLSAVIDFGDICAGDPATDMAIAWMLFDKDDRDTFRQSLSIGDHSIDIHTWNRARAWALALGATFMANSDDNPALRRIGAATLARVLER